MSSDIERDLAELRQQSDRIEYMISVVLGKLMSKSEKYYTLKQKIKEKGKISVFEARKLLQISRPWATDLLKRIGQEEGFTFVAADKENNRPARVFYQKNRLFLSQFNAFESLFGKKTLVTLSDINRVFGLEINDLRALVLAFIEYSKNYKIEGFSVYKIEKTTPRNNSCSSTTTTTEMT